MNALPFDDVQGFIIRGYRSFGYARHLVVTVTDAPAARNLLGRLTGPDDGSGLRITTAAAWREKPDYTLNAGFTCEGLQALGLSSDQLKPFPQEFIDGAIGNAETVFDTDSSAPPNWVGGMGTASNVHVIFSLFAQTDQALESRSAELRSELAAGFHESYSQDGKALPGGFVHFGFKDGISEPSLAGGPPPSHPYPGFDVCGDGPAVAPNNDGRSAPGDFLIGYDNFFGNQYSPGMEEHWKNSSFGAFRILKQDVVSFDRYLQQAAPAAGLTPDALAAKFLGRWRNGNPLVLSPSGGCPIPSAQLNMFLYAETAPGQSSADPKGLACPAGAHIRRGNPRDEGVAGCYTQQARIIRRNVPYGPPFDAGNPDDGVERGLIGYFINADFANQFQFLMSQWINLDNFTHPFITGRDPILGANDPSTSVFTIATPNGPVTVKNFPRFVITRGSAYCFLPSISGLKYLASVGGS